MTAYQLLGPLATGGMAEILLARSASLDRLLAVKRILPERASDPESVRMLLDEARNAAALRHHRIVQVLDVELRDGVVFYAMEYLHGQTLAAVIERVGKLPLEAAIAIGIAIAEGLHHAHERPAPIVHRDVAPSNVMITYEGSIKLIDFGIAKAPDNLSKTAFGVFKGRLGYASPEQVRCELVDRRTDVYSLALVLYELTTGQSVFPAEGNQEAMLLRMVEARIPSPRSIDPQYPAELERIVMRGLAADRTQRYATAAAMQQDLEAFAKSAALNLSELAMSRLMSRMFAAELAPWQRARGAGQTLEQHVVEHTLRATPPETLRDPVDEEPTTLPFAEVRGKLGGNVGDRYRLGEQIGRGGMGDVLAAHDQLIGRDVAIKRLRGSRPDIILDRFMREACVQGRLEHPAIVPVHDLGVDSEGAPFFVMKKVDGTTLSQILLAPDPEKHSRQRLLRAFVEICLAVELAHTRGVIHRDLKPSNIVLGPFGEVYVIDWGIAKVVGHTEDDAKTLEGSEGPGETRAGVAVGTPGYMPPEQVNAARDVDARCDVYALGCVLFEILAGERLHPLGDAGMRSAVEGKDARPSLRAPSRDIAPELDAICVAATAKLRDDRIATARALGERVEKYLDGDRDVALRQQLGREHLERARAATDRSVAMREAGRALVIDPTSIEAAAFVGRMLVEPPAETPQEVERAIAGYDAGKQRVVLKTSRRASLGFLWIAPALVALAASHPILAALLVVLPMVSSMVAYRFAVDSPARMTAIVGGWAVYTALLAHVYSPIVFAPAFAAVAGASLAGSPPLRRGRSALAIALAFAGGIGLAWLLEGIGVLSSTVTVTHGTVSLTAPGFDIPPVITIATLVMWAFACVPGAVALGYMRRRHELELRRRLELQAWQLRQLFPVD